MKLKMNHSAQVPLEPYTKLKTEKDNSLPLKSCVKMIDMWKKNLKLLD